MKTLLWREYRQNGLLLIAGAALLLFPYIMTAIVVVWPGGPAYEGQAIASYFLIAAILSYSISQLTIALLGGNSFAGERADRSAEFLAYLPLSRERRVASKLLLTGIVAATIWGLNFAVIWGMHHFLPWPVPAPESDLVGYTAVTGFVMFGVGWLISAIQSSATFAVCGGIITPILTVMALFLSLQIGHQISPEAIESIDPERYLETGYTVSNLVLGTLGFAIGTRYFLKRVEP
jgi:ABC-type transport system involved in multi-copper enzyme maturation permease subunit